MKATKKAVLNIVVALAAFSAQGKSIDVKRSTITIHVGKAGLFSAAGHEHWVNAPITSGVMNDSQEPNVEFKVAAANMQVKPDPKVDSKTHAEIQRDMQERVLESSKYPDIVFRSSRIHAISDGQWRVEGTLTLHGVTKPVSITVKRSGDSYAGEAVIKQTDFNIKPITVGGGLVKVKNELEIAFRIVPL